jgi:antitoxin VapB
MSGAVTTRSTVFKSNRSQAVRLPKDVAFPEGVHEVEIVKVGNTRIISPVGQRWDAFFKHSEPFPEDFSRDQPPMQEREY